MPRPFPAEFRLRAVALVRAGEPFTTAAAQLGVRAGALHRRVRQDQIDRGERPGITNPESAELSKAKKRIRQLETEVEILKIVQAQKDSPGSRPVHRSRLPGQAVLPTPRSEQPRLLQIQKPSDVAHRNATPVAYRGDQRSAYCVSANLRFPLDPCGADDRHENPGERAPGGCSDEQSRHPRPPRARNSETTPRDRHRG